MSTTAPSADPGPTRRRLRRSTQDRDLAGVLGGLSEALGVESGWLRLAVVAVTAYLAFGTGGGAQLLVVVPYALAWALVPTAGARSLLLQIRRRAALQELALIVLLVITTTVVVARPRLGAVAVLSGLAALLLRDRPDADGPADHPPPQPAPSGVEPPATRGDHEPDPIAAPASSAPTQPHPRRARPEPRPKREPALWPLATGAVALVGIAAAAALVAGWVVDVRLVANLLLAVVGTVMALSAWRGRARILLLTCPLLLVLWFATSAADIGGHAGAGRRFERPEATGPNSTLSYELGYGLLQVDLTALDLEPGSRTVVDLGLSVGVAQVTLPPDARIEVRGKVGLGVVDAPRTWGSEPNLVAHRHLDLRRQPLTPTCEPLGLAATELWDLARAAGLDPDATLLSGGSASHGTETVPDAPAIPPPHAPDDGTPAPTPPSRRVDADLLDLVEAAGYPRPVVIGQDRWQDDGLLVEEDVVEVHVSSQWTLCQPRPPDPNPPVVVLDATIGLGALEVHRA